MSLRFIGSLLLSALLVAPATGEVVIIKGAKVHTGAGKTIENGVVVIRDGEIVSVGTSMPDADDATVIDVEGAEITPGLIDANARSSHVTS